MKAKGPKLYKEQKHSGEIAEGDFKFMFQNPDGDADFDAAHNLAVIEKTIKLTKEREARLRKEYLEQVEERVDAGISLLKAMSKGKYNSSDPHTAAMKYFGKKELARLRGEEIREEIRTKLEMAKKLMES